MKNGIARLLIIGAVLAIVAGAGTWYWHREAQPAVKFRTDAVKRGDLVPTISATGTVEPEEVIDVGAQVAGLITSFGKDLSGKSIDYGSLVDEGTVLARIDDTLYAADAATAAAQLRRPRPASCAPRPTWPR